MTWLHSVSDCITVFTLVPHGDWSIPHVQYIEVAVLCTGSMRTFQYGYPELSFLHLQQHFVPLDLMKYKKKVTCTCIMIIWSTLKEHTHVQPDQHAKKDRSDGCRERPVWWMQRKTGLMDAKKDRSDGCKERLVWWTTGLVSHLPNQRGTGWESGTVGD